jgi:hypothetical protein
LLVLFYEVEWMGSSTVYERHVLGNQSDPLEHITDALHLGMRRERVSFPSVK